MVINGTASFAFFFFFFFVLIVIFVISANNVNSFFLRNVGVERTNVKCG